MIPFDCAGIFHAMKMEDELPTDNKGADIFVGIDSAVVAEIASLLEQPYIVHASIYEKKQNGDRFIIMSEYDIPT